MLTTPLVLHFFLLSLLILPFLSSVIKSSKESFSAGLASTLALFSFYSFFRSICKVQAAAAFASPTTADTFPSLARLPIYADSWVSSTYGSTADWSNWSIAKLLPAVWKVTHPLLTARMDIGQQRMRLWMVREWDTGTGKCSGHCRW